MGKKSKKKVQWRRLSLNELQSNETSSKRRQRKTPERGGKDDERSAWDARQPAQADHSTGTNKRGPPSGEELPDIRFHKQQDDNFSNYNNHASNANQRLSNNFYDRRFQNNGNGNNNHHVMNGGGFQKGIQPHDRYEPPNYHCGFNNRGGMMDRPYRNFDRDRNRFYNNYPSVPFERYGRDASCNGPNVPMVPNGPMGPNGPIGPHGFYHDRWRPMYRMNGRPTNGYPNNYGGGVGSPSMRRRWSNGDEPAYNLPPRNPSSYQNGNSDNPHYRDGSHCGNGHDSGGSNGYEGGSSETQSEPEERQSLHQPVQSILIDNDQYTKIQTPRQEVIFKKNSGGGGGCPPCPTPPSRSHSLTTDRPPQHKADSAKRAGSTTALSRNKKNRAEAATALKLENSNKSTLTTSTNKKQNRRGDASHAKKGSDQGDQMRLRTGKDNGGQPVDGGKTGNKKQSARPDRNPMPGKQDTDETQSDNTPVREDDEDYCAESDEDEDEEDLYHQEEYPYPQDYPYLQDMQAGVIMQQCYPGGPMVSIPVHWTSFLDPSLIPGDTALTPLDPAFTHLLDPSFKPLDAAKWDNSDPEAGSPNVIIPDTVIPVQHDAAGCPVTVQVNVDENGVPIKIEPSAFTVQLSSLGQQHQHHPSCQMAGLDLGLPLHYTPYAESNHRNQYFEYNFDEGLEKRLEQKIDEELAKHYSDEEDEKIEEGNDKKTPKEERRDSRDCEETSYDSQYASMSEGSSLPTSPAGELSDSPSTCPPNTPSEADMGEGSTPSILKSSVTPVREASPNPFPCTLPAATTTGSSISISSASTLCASSSSSSSTLVSLCSSPVNSGNPSKETSPSSPRQPSLVQEGLNTTSLHSDQRGSGFLFDDPKRLYDKHGESDEDLFGKSVVELPSMGNECTAVECYADSVCNVVGENKVVIDLSDNVDRKNEFNEVTTDIVPKRNTATETHDSKTITDNFEESIRIKSIEEYSSATDVDNESNTEIGNSKSETIVSERSQEDALPENETATSVDLNTVPDINLSLGTVLTAAPKNVTGDVLEDNLVPDSSIASECVDLQNSPDGASDDAPQQLMDDQGVTVTVKPGYVMVPILTPYYDPSVLYGYQMMSNEGHMDHNHYPGSNTSKKKKKKHNRRRGIENNSISYLDTDMYAGEPYVTTPEGFLMPMDASMCHYPMPGSLPYLHPMQQYQYEMLQQQIVGQQFHQSCDEGFVSVEHSPFLPDIIPSPSDQTPDTKPLTGGENKFGKLHETERQQIKDVLDDNKIPTAGESCAADLSDSGVSETEEVPGAAKPCHLKESSVSDPMSNDTDLCVMEHSHPLMDMAETQTNDRDSNVTVKLERQNCEADISLHHSAEVSEFVQPVDGHQLSDDETNTAIVKDSQTEISSIYISSVADEESLHDTSSNCDKDEENTMKDDKEDYRNSIAQTSSPYQEMEGEEHETNSSNANLMVEANLPLKIKRINDEEITNEGESAVLNCSVDSVQPMLIKPTAIKTDTESCIVHLIDGECDLSNETATAMEDPLDVTLDCKEPSRSEKSKCNQSSSLVKEESLSSTETDNSDLSSDVSLNDGVTDAMVAELKQEMTLAQSLLDTRISCSSAKRGTLADPSISRKDSSTLMDLKVTEAVRRWIREVTPEKAFTLHSEGAKSALMDSRLSETSEDDEYFEDDVVDPGGGEGKFVCNVATQNTPRDAMAKPDTNTDDLSKNVKGNPFGALCSKSNCSVQFTKRVATCSISSDILDDYDGCSSVSSLSHGPLFSPPSSQIISQSSSRTITPNRSQECDHDEVDLKACTCDPSGCRKYYQLAAEVDDSPVYTPRPMSPDDIKSSAERGVSPLSAEVIKVDKCDIHSSLHLESGIFCPHCHCPASRPSCQPFSDDKALTSPTSNCSSGLGSSLASTPALSPQHPSLHRPHSSSSPRHPFMLLPPNIRAESGSASLNTIHCCSLM